ncbi:hypothetical protein BD414DRAFT_484231 [Trametes punicea]|nr:hypothetical protein BD414DRAFT_484231 [Trametes punicea]
MVTLSQRSAQRLRPQVGHPDFLASKHTVGLPIEIWVLILREAQYDDLVPRYKWLRRYCLVCRAWQPHAQRLLFTHVFLRGSGYCKSFITAILSSGDPAHRERLQMSVRTVSMLMDHQDIYPDVLQLCPDMRELHLSMYHASFRPDVLARLAAALPRSIRALRVRTYHYTALFQLLPLFSGIEFLEIDCHGHNAPMPHPPPSPPPPWCLRELRYSNRQRGTHGPIEWALSGPGAGSRSTLEALRVECPTFDPSILSSLGICNLRSLAIPRVSTGDSLSQLNRLEEIWMTCPRYPSLTFLPLPASIRHLVLHQLSEDANYEHLISDLSTYYEQANRQLKVITYHRRCEGDIESVEDIRMLHEFCLSRNIEFRLMDPPYGFYAGERIPFEPLSPSECPRLLPLSSRRLSSQNQLASVLVNRKKPTLTQKIADTAKKAFRSPIPAVALARP